METQPIEIILLPDDPRLGSVTNGELRFPSLTIKGQPIFSRASLITQHIGDGYFYAFEALQSHDVVVKLGKDKETKGITHGKLTPSED